MPHLMSLRTHNQAPQFTSQICRRWEVSSGKSLFCRRVLGFDPLLKREGIFLSVSPAACFE